MKSKRLLILSDGKPGHVNQSIAFARHLRCGFDLCQVAFKNRSLKVLSCLFDRFSYYSESLIATDFEPGEYSAVVSAGSETYYANRMLAKRLGAKAIAIMLPQGYRYDFDLIVAQAHDNPPNHGNIINLPINLSYVEPKGLVIPESRARYIALIIGGSSGYIALDPIVLKQQIDKIIGVFPEHRIWMTTSRRTPVEIERLLCEYNFERAVYYSQEPINPIPDFLQHSEYVFLTADSTSMISEAVSYGTARVEILPDGVKVGDKGKLGRFIKRLEELNSLHVFHGSIGQSQYKINLGELLNTASRAVWTDNER